MDTFLVDISLDIVAQTQCPRLNSIDSSVYEDILTEMNRLKITRDGNRQCLNTLKYECVLFEFNHLQNTIVLLNQDLSDFENTISIL